jgi:adenine-specific DNA-methyltransferase
MDSISPIETRRLDLQEELDASKTQRERNRMGQFATPTLLASDILAYARTLLPANEPIRFLDPAFGTGSFYAALLRHFPAKRIRGAMGIEIDPHYGRPARRFWRDHPLEIKLGDFTALKSPADAFNLLICNPPYVRHHHIGTEQKQRLQTMAAASCGVRIAGLAGLYCYFLGLAHAWLANDGVAGWLIPSEFMDVNYGGPVKRYLLNHVELLRVHRFDPNEVQFDDALVSSAVVWFRKHQPSLKHEVEFSFGGTLAAPKHLRCIAATALQHATKWTSLATAGLKAEKLGPRLSDFFSVKRGLATGDNSFFILSREEIERHSLPLQFFTPILPGPRHLPTDVIEANEDGTPKLERLRFLLDCNLREDEIQQLHPALWDYLQTGKPQVAKTYLCSRRRPWYAQEKRPAAPFICTYMGRGLAKRTKPFRFILNRSRATAANVYLLLYPKPPLAKALVDDPDLSDRIWKFLNSISPEALLSEGRVYGGGLYKMEPKELANVPADTIAALFPTLGNVMSVQGEMFGVRAA